MLDHFLQENVNKSSHTNDIKNLLDSLENVLSQIDSNIRVLSKSTSSITRQIRDMEAALEKENTTV